MMLTAQSLIICKGVLYVNDNNIWICAEKQVDKLLIDMIGKLDIMFYGADGKRQYHYNKASSILKIVLFVSRQTKLLLMINFMII